MCLSLGVDYYTISAYDVPYRSNVRHMRAGRIFLLLLLLILLLLPLLIMHRATDAAANDVRLDSTAFLLNLVMKRKNFVSFLHLITANAMIDVRVFCIHNFGFVFFSLR